jgi:hypothetical protein
MPEKAANPKLGQKFIEKSLYFASAPIAKPRIKPINKGSPAGPNLYCISS